MTEPRAYLLWLLLLAVGYAGSAVTAPHSARTPQVELTLQSGQPAYPPGGTLWAGLRFDLEPHWHVYWRNPGDSGEAPRVEWTLPPGWQAGAIHWPVPGRIPVGPLVNYGYENRVTLLVPLRVPSGAGGDARLVADVHWLVCREECIPQQARLELQLPAAASANPGHPDGRFEAVRKQWPLPFTGRATYRPVDGYLELRLDDLPWGTEGIDDLWFAAHSWGPVAPSGRQTWQAVDDGLVLRIPPGEAPPSPGTALDGLLVVTERSNGDAFIHGFTLTAAAASASATAERALTLPLALGLALLGGLLLNLMPCVLPVLSIKALGLVRHTDHRARHALAFAAGVLLSFTALAATLLALRAGGNALGWGFQLQEPLVITGLMYLMLALAMNLSGVFSIGHALAGVGQSLTERTGPGGTFATGVLAVVVASPCTAPFMGSALGFALTRPPIEALLVFVALGAGFALPLTALSIWPAWMRFLPPPGAWMERLRNGLAFPMYAAAAWLLWVLSQQVDGPALAAVLGGAVLLAFALWWYGLALRHRRRQLLVAGLAGLLGIGLAATVADTTEVSPGASHAQTWSPQRVTELRAAGRPVLVNFTAAWCITCKVNEQVALTAGPVREALERRNVAYLKADWTRRDAAITAELQRHGRSGVPLYLLFPPGDGPPRVLPQLLTEGMVLRAIEQI